MENEQLVVQVQRGDASAIEVLWVANRGLVAHIARRYTPLVAGRSDLDLDDLIQAGFFGLHTAAKAYDTERGAKFSTFAVFYIRREMRRTLGISTTKQDLHITATSLDAPLNADEADGTRRVDTIASQEPDDDPLERDELQRAVRAAVERMKHEAARRTIEAHYFEGKPQTRLAEAEGISDAAIYERITNGCRELYNDRELQKWAVDYDYANVYRKKGVTAFKSSFSSVVEDIVIRTDEERRKGAALADVLGSLA
ncbi:hypothetical protein FACS189425_04810 [Clostridia bacterium]|nr:hypothetical protein FACS189425_04810 [Clostridia bacterium]